MARLLLLIVMACIAGSASAQEAEAGGLSAPELALLEGADGRQFVPGLAAADTEQGDPLRWADPWAQALDYEGEPSDGVLLTAIALPSHPGYRIRDADRAWASPCAAAAVADAFDVVVQKHPASTQVVLLDASTRHGGPMRGHRSHQSGVDVDFAFYQNGCDGACGLRATRPDTLDADLQWSLLHAWLQVRAARLIFIDYALQAPLHAAAKRAGVGERKLASWFQFPAGEDSATGIIRHAPNHEDHVHVRFRCEQSAARSTAQGRATDGMAILLEGLTTDEQHTLDLMDSNERSVR